MGKKKPINYTNIIRYICLFLILIAVEFFLLVTSALIPKDLLKQNMTESADYLCEKQVFFYQNQRDASSLIDRYADSILLNIAYSYDSAHPVSSIMRASYYYTDTQNENNNLHATVTKNFPPNKEYSRYWHGSIAILRPLLTCFTLKEIYIILGIILYFLLILLLFFIKNHYKTAFFLIFIVGFVAISVWYTPMSLEYIWTILISLSFSILSIRLYNKGDEKLLTLLFIAGSITAYMDFLTTETLTLLIPLLLILLRKYDDLPKGESIKPLISFGIHGGILWFLSYALTWGIKWLLASLILQKNVLTDALSQVSYRTTGDIVSLKMPMQLGAVFKNLSCLFPFSYMKENNYLAVLGVSIALFICFMIFQKPWRECKFSLLLLGIACIPYIRYIALANHSYVHFFFTYRAQLASILCVLSAYVYGLDYDFIHKQFKKLKTRKKARKH